jgi:DNA-binding CsgD family transcriptional regulator
VAFRAIGDRGYVAAARGQQGAAALRLGDHATARRFYAESLTIASELDDRGWIAWALAGAAHLAFHEGPRERAARLLATAMQGVTEIGQRRIDDWLAEHLLAALGGVAGDATWHQHVAVPIDQAITEAMQVLGAAKGDPERMGDLRLLQTLTAREREVLGLLTAGYADKEIAAMLGVARHTASHHVAAIRRKLGATSRAAVVALAVRGG